jgi:hypothetical protein
LKSYLDQQQHPRAVKPQRRRKQRPHSPSQPLAEYSAQRESSNAASNSDSSEDQWKMVNRRRKRTRTVQPVTTPPAPSATQTSAPVARPPQTRLADLAPPAAAAPTPARAPGVAPARPAPADNSVNISREEYLSMQQQIAELTNLVAQLIKAINARSPSSTQSLSAFAQERDIEDRMVEDITTTRSTTVRKRAREPSPMTSPPPSTSRADDPTGKHSEDEQKRDDSTTGSDYGVPSSPPRIIPVDASGQRSGSRALKALEPHRPNEASIFHTPAVTGRTRHQAGSHAAALSNG